ncbi:MAG: polysaccharide deacetylase family protein [Coriobacteriia bacterium]|nr:polysaccharide deacetylase family protein [Coriobacteriia bacterium]
MNNSSHKTSRALPVPSWPAVLLGVLVLASAAAVALPAFGSVGVVVDGRVREVPAGIAAASIVENSLCEASPGDLVSVSGTLLRPGHGEPVTLVRDGLRLDPDAPVFADDRIGSIDGADTTEAVVTTSAPIPIPVEFTGSGALCEVKQPGAVGIRRLVVGEISGDVVTSTVELEPVPLIIQRSSPSNGRKVVALTFDDGPWKGQTARILDILKAEDVKATFFMVGSRVRKNPSIARRVAKEGHEIGNHSDTHKMLGRASEQTVRNEIRRAQRTIREVVDVTPKWFRPAGGSVGPYVTPEARKAKLRVITWSVDPEDWRASKPGPIARSVRKAVKPGSVILLHDGGGEREDTIRALPWIIHNLRKQGYTFVTLDELYN